MPGGLSFGPTYQSDGATLCLLAAGVCSVATTAPPTGGGGSSAPPTPAGGQAPPSGGTAKPATTTVPLSTIATLPPAKSCVSRRDFRIRLRVPKGKKITSAEVRVAGKKVAVLKGKRLTSRVRLTGLPKGTFKVKVTLIASDGAKLEGTRTYHTCAEKRSAKRASRV